MDCLKYQMNPAGTYLKQTVEIEHKKYNAKLGLK